jgi:hypothetical protein
MPQTSLISTDLSITKEYIVNTCELYEKEDKDDEDEEDCYKFDKYQFIKPGMTFTMSYTESFNYNLTEKIVKVTVVSITAIIEACCSYNEVCLIGCKLKTDEPIFVAAPYADLSRPITLHTDTLPIATGRIKSI